MIHGLAPVHPGEILREGFLAPMHLSAHTLARAIGVAPVQIERKHRIDPPYQKRRFVDLLYAQISLRAPDGGEAEDKEYDLKQLAKPIPSPADPAFEGEEQSDEPHPSAPPCFTCW